MDSPEWSMVGIDTTGIAVELLLEVDIVLELDIDQLVGNLVGDIVVHTTMEDTTLASAGVAKAGTKHDQPHINNDSYLALAGSYDAP